MSIQVDTIPLAKNSQKQPKKAKKWPNSKKNVKKIKF